MMLGALAGANIRTIPHRTRPGSRHTPDKKRADDNVKIISVHTSTGPTVYEGKNKRNQLSNLAGMLADGGLRLSGIRGKGNHTLVPHRARLSSRHTWLECWRMAA